MSPTRPYRSSLSRTPDAPRSGGSCPFASFAGVEPPRSPPSRRWCPAAPRDGARATDSRSPPPPRRHSPASRTPRRTAAGFGSPPLSARWSRDRAGGRSARDGFGRLPPSAGRRARRPGRWLQCGACISALRTLRAVQRQWDAFGPAVVSSLRRYQLLHERSEVIVCRCPEPCPLDLAVPVIGVPISSWLLVCTMLGTL